MSGDTHLSLGEYLRQERERRGITIEQVASATKIGVKTLHQLEADHYAELPAKPFVRGFVNSYARFIGIDSKETLTRFGAFIDAKAHDRPNRDGGHSGYAFEKRDGEHQSRTILWVVMGSFVLAGGLATLFIKKPLRGGHHGSHADKLRAAYGVASPSPSPSPSSSLVPAPAASIGAAPSPSPSPKEKEKEKDKPTPMPTPAAVTPPSASEASPKPTPAASEGAEEVSEDDPLNSGIKLTREEIRHRVVFRAVESAWVRYKVDNRPMMTFVIRAGKVLVLRARESIRFQASPPKAINYSYAGGPSKPIVGDQRTVSRQGDATLFFPSELANSIDEPFPGTKPLSVRSVPAPRPTASISPETP